MRKLLVDIYTYQTNAVWLTRDEEELPSDFLLELALQLLTKRTKPDNPLVSGDVSSHMEVKTQERT
jgi:hypothetical protein